MGGLRPARTGSPPLRPLSRAAAVDIGTNSTRLLIAEARGSRLTDIARIDTVTGLGRGVDASGRLSGEAIARTVRVLASYGRRIEEAGVRNARAVATSASRDAANRDRFLAAARQALGFRPEIISGDEEAALVFAGATAGLADPGGAVVIDIGGGSTEIVTGVGGVSTDIGSIRLTERRLPDHPARPEHLAASRREARRVLSAAETPRRSRGMGTAGTWTTLAVLSLGLDAYDPDVLEGATLSLADLEGMVAWLASLTLEEKRAIPGLHPMRAPIILGGAIVAETSLRVLNLEEVTVTGHDLLDGVCRRLLVGG